MPARNWKGLPCQLILESYTVGVLSTEPADCEFLTFGMNQFSRRRPLSCEFQSICRRAVGSR